MITNLVNNCFQNARRLFAPACMLCGDPTGDGQSLCAPCDAALPRLSGVCPRCANPLTSKQPVLCGTCQQSPPAFAATRALFRYESPVDSLIHGLKYHGRLDLARLLGTLFAAALTRDGARTIDVLVPVPLDHARLRSRGYNQSLELARPVAQRIGLPIDAFGVRRTRATRPQAELSRAGRRENMRGAFVVDADYRDKSVAIVDDVMTSGATADALSSELLAAGARRVEVWAVARA